ncbi:extracellular solute-binding protein [Paenibacillus abyssi]|uniref:ABC transporter peptide-binding protein YtcQ n=1 Tax=Paenibacillus abyssi TaxID=1340531 RepID=A0A917G364_9BACL|nr:extracellular solute-binding protein [Paenibacillus abyssi]GGG19493.1 putative ABC transporter peptide-binding protein YtcQ [Paenibacillus abyssi]
MKRKWLYLLLTFTLVFSVLAACSGGGNSNNSTDTGGSNTGAVNSGGSTNGTNAKEETPPADTSEQYGDTGGLQLPLVDEPTTLSWMLVSENTNLNTSLIATEIEKRTGIKLDIQAYPSSTYKDKLKVVLASGNLPDIFHGLTIAEINDMGSQDVVTPINEYIDQLPNFKKLYAEENDWVMKSYSDDKGNMYHWPIFGVNREVNHGFLYRKDVFDANGIPLWNNTDEFYEAMKKLKEIYPDSYPIASKTKEFFFRDWGYGWGVVGADYPMFYDENDKTWGLTFTQPEYKEMLDFAKKLYNEGLLDPEFITDTAASWTSKMTTANRSFVTFDWIGVLDTFHNQVKAEIPEYDLRYGNPVGPTNTIRSLPQVSVFGLTVTNNDKKEAALKLLDYLSSPSGAELVMLGVEGVSFVEGADGSISYPELADAEKVDIKLLEEKYGLWLEGMYLRADERSVYFNFTEKEQEAQDNMKDKRQPLDPVLKFTNEENTAKADLYNAIYQAGVEFSTKYILNKNHGDAEWEAWLAQAKKLGEDKYVEVYKNAQARFDGQ